MSRATSKVKRNGGVTAESLLRRFQDHLKYTRGRHSAGATDFDKLASLSLAIRDLAVGRMLSTQKAYHDREVKRVYYLSMEFLMGRLLSNNIISLGLRPVVEQVLGRLGLDFERLCSFEPDAGLGNGGLGRLAACFLDSLATLEYPGIRLRHPLRARHVPAGVR